MPKLTDLNILEIFDKDKIQFKTPVSVTKDGLFTTTLPESAVARLKEFGLDMAQNRSGREGFFSNKTLEGLDKDIHAFVKECISRQVIEDKLVIKYRVQTKASYIVDVDGEIVPNGYWVKNHKDFEDNKVHWHEGNANFAGQYFTPSLSVYAMVFRKVKYSYKSGKTVTNYHYYKPVSGSRAAVDWLASQVNVVSGDYGFSKDKDLERLPEIDATPEVADFFVKMVKAIDELNERFSKLNEPEYVLALLAANGPKKIEF